MGSFLFVDLLKSIYEENNKTSEFSGLNNSPELPLDADKVIR